MMSYLPEGLAICGLCGLLAFLRARRLSIQFAAEERACELARAAAVYLHWARWSEARYADPSDHSKGSGMSATAWDALLDLVRAADNADVQQACRANPKLAATLHRAQSFAARGTKS